MSTKLTYQQSPTTHYLGLRTRLFEGPRNARRVPHPNLQIIVGANSMLIAEVPTTQTYKPIAVAAIDIPCHAGPTGSVIYDGLDCDPCSNLDITHAIAYFFDGAAEFMAQSQGYLLVGNGVGSGGHNVGASKIFMQIWNTIMSRSFQRPKERCVIPVPHMPTYAGFT